jgi:DNA helicase-2/ATP-dependent DNA helicase PcrA
VSTTTDDPIPPHGDLTPATVHLLASGEIERRWGPPGTGKSTSLKKTIGELVAQYGPDSVAVTSFTVTAAKSIAAMDLPLPDRQVGTLHSLAFRALGHPDVALDPKVIKDWNSRVSNEWRITADARRASPDAVESGVGGDSGDALLSAYDMARARLLPFDAMPADVRRFATAWDGWKRETDCIDYTDMISMALERARDGEHAPGNPQVLISDEAQDMTALETALLLAWRAPRTLFALDDDQAINEWRGGDAGPILSLGTGLDGGEQDGVHVIDTPLTQSYRIPAALHTIAQTWIEQCSRRREKEYRPRDYDGQVYAVRYPIEHPATAEAIARDAHAGRSVMVIASCEYMLRQLVGNLRRLGVPFANRYRPAEGRWNPLHAASGMTTAERLYRYLVLDEQTLGDRARLWTGEDVRAWLALVGVKEAGLARGAKTKAQVLPSGTLDVAQVMALFGDEETFYDASEPSLDWLLRGARGIAGLVGIADRPGKLDYPAAVARKFGPGALVDEPPVTVGTIHSVKGAQADVVYVSPSLSPAGYGEWMRGARARDSVIRLLYVGLTRARQTCVVLNSTEKCVPPDELCPPEMSVR